MNLIEQIKVNPKSVEYVRSLYAPPDNPVFELVPQTFATYAAKIYKTMGEPTVTRENVWAVYLALLDSFHQLEEILEDDHVQWHHIATLAREDNPEELELLQGLRELPNGLENPRDDGSYYMGGVNNGQGLSNDSAFFTSDMQTKKVP